MRLSFALPLLALVLAVPAAAVRAQSRTGDRPAKDIHDGPPGSGRG